MVLTQHDARLLEKLEQQEGNKLSQEAFTERFSWWMSASGR